MDRRTTPSNDRVAHVSLRGQVDADRFVESEPHQVTAIVADILSSPVGTRERQLLRGDTFHVLEVRDGCAFGYADKDGYVGWLNAADIADATTQTPTHLITAARSYAKSTPGLKAMGHVTPLPFGAGLVVVETVESWSKVAWERGSIPHDLFVPSAHLQPIDHAETDPVVVAEKLLGTPYLWGGNSSFGIDCSGLVQAALLACDTPCPGDSDLQEAAFADATGGYQRGDLLFWRGHVAMVTDADTLIHANAHHMAVAHEPIAAATARIHAQGDGPVTSHSRPAYGGCK